GIADRKDQGLGDTAQAEAAGHDGHAILEQPGQRGFGIRMDLVHDRSISPGKELRIAGPAERSTGSGADAEAEAIWRWSAASGPRRADSRADNRSRTRRRRRTAPRQ